MKRYALAALLATVALTLASCGGSASGGSGNVQEDARQDSGGGSNENAEHEHSGTGHDEDHGSGAETSSEDMAQRSRQMVMPNGEYSDKAFIDSMIPHHEGAVEMAEVALDNAEREKIRVLSEEIVSTQRTEIETLGRIRQEEFGSPGSEMGMSEEDMQAMGMSSDPEKLAQADPFDEAFIDSMIPHHESAIVMAETASDESGNPRIRELATSIVDAQEREIAQMEEWRSEWYPEG